MLNGHKKIGLTAMRYILALIVPIMISGCVWHPRTADSKAPSWARLADTAHLVCDYHRPVGSNRKVRTCRSQEQAALEQASGEAFVRKHQEPQSRLWEQRSPRGN